MAERLTDEEQQERSAWFRHHWEHGVAYNRHNGIRVDRWDADGVEFYLPYRDELSAHVGIFHGGAVGSLIDTAATGAIIAGHDFNYGSRLTTISMSLQYLSAARGEDLICRARCTRRGRRINFAEARVEGAVSGALVATGQVAANISGERPGAPWATNA